jgi:hypothetical protein
LLFVTFGAHLKVDYFYRSKLMIDSIMTIFHHFSAKAAFIKGQPKNQGPTPDPGHTIF